MIQDFRHKLLSTCIFLLFSLACSGCGFLTHPDYVAPQFDLPGFWSHAELSEKALASEEKFWEGFQDPTLNQLIEQVLLLNNDIRTAAIKVQRARLEVGISRTDLFPTLSAGADASHSYDLDSDDANHSYGLSAGLSYEMDLWGRYSDAYNVAQLEVEASAADKKSAELSVIGTTAELYWQIGYLNRSLQLAHDNIAIAKRTLKIVEAKYAAGSVGFAELINSQQNLLSLQVNLTGQLQKLVEARSGLAILLNQPPETIFSEPKDLPGGPLPVVKVGVPADILRNRPDLLAAELRLRQSHVQIGVTQASYYPNISLTGNLGTSSTQLRELLQNPLATLGAGLALPFLQWDLTKLEVHMAENTYLNAVVSFRQTLHTALAEVENSLSSRQLNLEQGENLQQALFLAIDTERISRQRYEVGSDELRDWLNEQNSRCVAEQAVLDNHLSQLKNMMQLYLALGGYPADKQKST